MRTSLIIRKLRGKASTASMLVYLGVPSRLVYANKNRVKKHYSYRTRKYRRSVFYQPEQALYDILELARDRYREKVKMHHPDKTKVDAEKFIALNLAWEKVKKNFKKRGIELG